jgi:hypothetical protein
MATRIIFELDDAGSIVAVSHEPSNPPDPPPTIATPTTDEANVARQLLNACGIVDIETLIRTYPTPRLVRVAAHGLWRWRRGEIKGKTPAGLVLTILHADGPVPDHVHEALEQMKPKTRTATDEQRERDERQTSARMIEEYLARRKA